jgi:UDP-glucose:glycoprotein glucosyltransferase
MYGHRLRGSSALHFPGTANLPGSGLVNALQDIIGAEGEHHLRVAHALAICSQASQAIRALQDSGEQHTVPSSLENAFSHAPAELQIHLPARKDEQEFPLQIFAAFDPLGQEAQRLPAVLKLLHDELNAEVRILLCPRPLVAPPLLKYYRSAMAASSPLGGLGEWGQSQASRTLVRFTLPVRRNMLFGAQLITPEAWLCSAVDSGGADLESLRADINGTVRARYILEALFVEGFAQQENGRPAAGRHMALVPVGGTSPDGVAGRDAVVVKSGYFQLRAPPGLYEVAPQASGGDFNEVLKSPGGLVEITDLVGRSSLLNVRLEPAKGSKLSSTPSQGLKADGDSSYEGVGGNPRTCTETVHIFSVASGHRYERLLRIMMLSVREHTKCPLRFWLVENFLSPNFRRILPGLAKRVGFAVTTVTYKWPSWLRAQVEKQRVIWAYKILFLDVLFPLQVKKVLFIDADQIVRADVRELWQINLHGAVYGFVPFCGSGPESQSTASRLWGWGSQKTSDAKNEETMGLRFWEQGFWKKHLGGMHYHISALFVVNLELFRAQAAGDHLRDVYQALTEDPSSLANLDQDLPNYVQRELNIFSLPAEWLWCETWCSNATKAHANN